MNIYELAYRIISHENSECLEKDTYSLNGIAIKLNNISFAGNNLYIIFNFDENVACIGYKIDVFSSVLSEFNTEDIDCFDIMDYPWNKIEGKT